MQAQLIEWVMENRNQGHCVSGRMIRLRALQILNDKYTIHTNFTASLGWLQRFLTRHKLSLRRVTTSGRDLPSNVGQIIDDFLKSSERNFIIPNIDLSNIANMDETSNII